MAWPPSTHQDVQDKIGALATPTKRTITGNYTLVAADIDFVLHVTSPTAVTITLPSDATAAIGQETEIKWRAYDVGQITFAAGSGATILSRLGAFRSARPYASGTITKVAANTWLVDGDLMV
jgi:hypothetical protein